MVVEILLSGIFLALAFYHFMVYFGRRHDPSNLYYAFICLLYSIIVWHFILYSGYKLYPKIVKENIYIWLIYFYGIVYLLFADSIFHIGKKIKTFFFYYMIATFCGTSTATILSFLKSNVKLTAIAFIFYTGYLIILFSYLFIAVFLKRKNKTKKEKVVLLGFASLIAYTIPLVFFNALSIKLPFITTHITFLFMVACFAYALTDAFNTEHKDLIELRKNLEQKVIERTQQLEQANKQKIDFFVNLAHETKTPLTIISNSFADYLSKHHNNDELDIIKHNIDKLKRDMINFLDIQKLENKQLFYNHDQIVELTSLIDEKLAIFNASLTRKNLILYREITPDKTYTKIDPDAADRILNNLLDNAIKYNKTEGSITIGLTRRTGRIMLTVTDTGPGIPENELEHVFEPYYQMSHQKRNTQGMGMGLAIVKEIITDIHGTIEVASTADRGACFTVTFTEYIPTKNDSITTTYEVSTPGLIPEGGTIDISENEFDESLNTLLVVEDNKALLTYLVSHLKDNYNVYYAINGHDALQKIPTINKPDLILSDIMMDIMDGYEFREKLNNNDEYNLVPFIFITAKSADKDRLKGLSMGAVDFISKPFVLEELLYKIQAILKISKALKKERIKELGTQLCDYLEKSTEKSNETPESIINDTIDSLALLSQKYKISNRELKVASMLTEGLLYKEIAFELNISLNTVRTYVKRLYKKLSISSTRELQVIFARVNT